MGRIRRQGPRARARARRARPLPRRVPRFVVSARFPEIADILLVVMVTRHRARCSCTSRDAAGRWPAACAVLPRPKGRRGVRQEAVHRRQASSARWRALQRYGVMAVLIPSSCRRRRRSRSSSCWPASSASARCACATAIAIGRGARYLALGILAVTYGDRAMAYMRETRAAGVAGRRRRSSRPASAAYPAVEQSADGQHVDRI